MVRTVGNLMQLMLVAGLLAGGSSTLHGVEPAPPGLAVETVPSTSAFQAALVGAGSCAASGCHGGLKTTSRGWQNAYTIWATEDQHQRAHRVLYDDLARQIVRALDHTPADAKVEPFFDRRCIGCHATVDPHLPKAAALLADGVSCESCHGPARDWLGTHYTWPEAELASRAKAQGMRYTKSLAERAAACVDCHVGAPPKPGETTTRDMNHDLIAAGHPRLNFEFSTYLAFMPRHWRQPSNLETRATDEARAWAVGRLVTARAALELLAGRATQAQPVTGALAAPWPEFSEYDCYRCHHGLTGDDRRARLTLEQRSPRDDLPLSSPRWGTWHFALLGLSGDNQPGDVAARGLATSLHALRQEMSRGYPVPQVVAREATQAAKNLDPAIAELSSITWEPTELTRRFAELANQARPTTWDQAAQSYLACVAIHHARHPQGTARLSAADARVHEALRGIFEQLRFDHHEPSANSPRAFDVAALQSAFAELATAVQALEP